MSYPEGLVTVAEDPKWQRASSLITNAESVIGLIDIPAHSFSLSQTNAHLTPKAIREALHRFSTQSYSADKNVAVQSIQDLGEIANPEQNEQQTIETISAANKELTIALGGDNSITYAAALGVYGNKLSSAGLITLDAHHDLRDGRSNGSPVRRLVEENCDYVGDRFAEEARKIHYGEADAHGIYGETTAEETERLKDEGIEFGSVPWIRDDA